METAIELGHLDEDFGPPIAELLSVCGVVAYLASSDPAAEGGSFKDLQKIMEKSDGKSADIRHITYAGLVATPYWKKNTWRRPSRNS